MFVKFFIIILVFIIVSCENKKSDLEICFECVANRIKTDSILKDIMYSPIDSYGNYGLLINNAVKLENKSNTICSQSIEIFLLENNKNSISINNLILFQYFQAYLKHEKFNLLSAQQRAYKYYPSGAEISETVSVPPSK